MKLLKLSKKLNPLGENMSLQEAFNQFKKQDHSASFGNLGEWLDQNSKKQKPMKMIYKIAASFVLTALIFVACTVPVQHEEEIGYMIKGTSHKTASEVSSAINILQTDTEEIPSSFAVHEIEGTDSLKSTEILFFLPNEDKEAALQKMARIKGTFAFETLELLPIEEVVKKPLYEVALSKFNIYTGNKISEEVMEERFNKVLHANSTIAGNAEIKMDKSGKKIVEIVIEEGQSSKDALNTIDVNTIKEITIRKKDGIKTVDIKLKGTDSLEQETEQ